ncbi:MAG: type II toxin-antitoxin system RelE/ParE family toxin [Pseudolabrys sp.]
MIRTFRSKPLAELWANGHSAKIGAKMHRRILVRLDRLSAASAPVQMNLPGFDFHALKGFVPTRYSIHVNGPWCITFEFDAGDALRVDFEQYH